MADHVKDALAALAKVEKPSRRPHSFEPPPALAKALLDMFNDGYSPRLIARALKDNPLGACETTIRRWLQNQPNSKR